MSEGIVYADLNFQISDKKEDIQEPDRHVSKVPPAPSCVSRNAVLILILLCLLLLLGLGILGGMFYTTLKMEMVKLNQLKDMKEELQRNVSLEMMHSSNAIQNLSSTLQNIATQLCWEMYRRQEHKCKPCSEGWKWYKDSCYFFHDKYQTWQDSEMFCLDKNATMLRITNKSALEFVKYRKLTYYWLRLVTQKDYADFKEMDERIFSYEWLEESTNDLSEKYCGYIYGMEIIYTFCTNKNRVICERKASKVKVDSVLGDHPGGSL